MRSVRNEEPADATAEELEQLLDEREQTLMEWYERSLIDPSTFDEESRERIREVMDESDDVFGSEATIQSFVERSLDILGGNLERAGNQLYRIEAPNELPGNTTAEAQPETRNPVTFSREFAMNNEGIEHLSPDDPLTQRLRDRILEDDRGRVGLKLLPFIDEPGITFVYRVAFEDGTGETIREELIPVYVDAKHSNPKRPLGKRVVDTDTVQAKPDAQTVQSLLSARDRLENEAEGYISNMIRTVQGEIDESRQTRVEQERSDLEAYAAAERERIETFIDQYEERAETGQDMDISIRNQRQRLERLEARIDERKHELARRGQVISLAPELEGWCLTLTM